MLVFCANECHVIHILIEKRLRLEIRGYTFVDWVDLETYSMHFWGDFKMPYEAFSPRISPRGHTWNSMINYLFRKWLAFLDKSLKSNWFFKKAIQWIDDFLSFFFFLLPLGDIESRKNPVIQEPFWEWMLMSLFKSISHSSCITQFSLLVPSSMIPLWYPSW